MSKSRIQISDLPPEIMVIIFSFCDPKTASGFRLVCKYFNACSQIYAEKYEIHHMPLNLPLGLENFASQIALRNAITKTFDNILESVNDAIESKYEDQSIPLLRKKTDDLMNDLYKVVNTGVMIYEKTITLIKNKCDEVKDSVDYSKAHSTWKPNTLNLMKQNLKLLKETSKSPIISAFFNSKLNSISYIDTRLCNMKFSNNKNKGTNTLMNIISNRNTMLHQISTKIYLFFEHNKTNSVNVNAQDIYGQTAMMHLLARVHGCSISEILKAVKILLENGADLDIRNLEGETALDYCKDASLKKILTLYKIGNKTSALSQIDAIISSANEQQSSLL